MKVAREHVAGIVGAVVLAAGAVTAGTVVTATNTSACHQRTSNGQQLPDSGCTPGVVDVKVTTADLCPHLGPSVVRLVTQATKDAVRARYSDHTAGEIDHLISLELGGTNDPANLWPEDGKIPNPKDKVEDALHRWVCAVPSAARLAQAQSAIRTDWTTAERIIQ